MKKFDDYQQAELWLSKEIIKKPDHITNSTFEKIAIGFILSDPTRNKNIHSNYEYAQKFYEWMMTGQTELSKELIEMNPWIKRFTDNKGLPESFSATYGLKIMNQLPKIIKELIDHRESRRAYINILMPDDQVILGVKTTHEFPCTIGLHFMIRDNKLNLIVNMRSNNVSAVMPYDVYNMTELQQEVARQLKLDLGTYYHQINNAHLYKGDVRRLKEILYVR